MSHAVLRNVTLIDGTGAGPKPNTMIVIHDRQIEAIGPVGSVNYPEDSTV
jgi:N-acyl-D-aspartate/D-glutamate deacylase